MARQDARTNLQAFVEYTTPNWRAGKIHREICGQLDRVVSGEIDRLMLLCPPQHGKSTITSKRLTPYLLGRVPTEDVLSASATAELAEGFGRDVRNCITSREYQRVFPGTALSADSTAKGRWHTKQGGSYYAVGIGAQLYGKGGMGIIDDPFGTWADAQSELARKNVWDWYQGTFYNRIRPSKPIVVIQHRMHEDDLVGRLLAAQATGGDRWTVVELPAHLDDPPWVERYDRPALERIQRNTDPRQWHALYMQNPTPDDGTYFRRDMFREYTDAPENLMRYMSIDAAITEDEKNDSTVIIEWGVDHQGDVYALWGWRGRKESTEWTELLIDRIAVTQPIYLIGEGSNIEKTVLPWMRKRMQERNVFCAVQLLPNVGDKPSKARSFQAMMASGRIYWPKHAWVEDFRSEMLKFPGGKHDDAVDACANMGRFLANMWAANPPRPKPKTFHDAWNAPIVAADMFRLPGERAA